MKTMQDEWRSYRDSCYTKGLPAMQNKEVHQAFFAGALTFLKITTDEIAALPDDEAVVEYAKLQREIKEIVQARIKTLEGRN